jgi:ankyrin repeat protein
LSFAVLVPGGLELLLEYGVELNFRFEGGLTLLAYAVRNRYLIAVEKLLSKGADPNICDDSGAFPVHCAVYNNGKEILNIFLVYGANFRVRNSTQQTCLHWAALANSLQSLFFFVWGGVDVNAADEYSRTAVYYTASKGFRSFCKALLERSAKQSDFEDGWKLYKENRTKEGEEKSKSTASGDTEIGILILLGIP